MLRALRFVMMASAVTLTGGLSSLASATTTLTPQQRAQGLTIEDLEANKKKLGNLTATITRNKASRFKYNGMLTYGARQDWAQERSPSLTTHRILGLASMTVLDREVNEGVDDDLASELATVNIAASGQFAMIGQEIQGNVNGGPMEASDLDISLSRGFDFDKIWGASNNLDLSIGSSVPTSESTQYEGVVAVPYASLGWALGFQNGRYNVTQAISGDYVVNRFAYSPTTKEVNPDGSIGYTVSTSARLGAGFRFTVGGSARAVHHLDDTTTAALANFQILSWTRGFATLTLRHSNGSRAEDHQTSFWFVDEYRRIISLGLSVRF